MVIANMYSPYCVLDTTANFSMYRNSFNAHCSFLYKYIIITDEILRYKQFPYFAQGHTAAKWDRNGCHPLLSFTTMMLFLKLFILKNFKKYREF